MHLILHLFFITLFQQSVTDAQKNALFEYFEEVNESTRGLTAELRTRRQEMPSMTKGEMHAFVRC
jgi:hypothetical protein